MVIVEQAGRIGFEVAVPHAICVDVVGVFGGWHRETIPLVPDESGIWRGAIDVPPGVHYYRYQVDGIKTVWDDDAHGLLTTHDGERWNRVYSPPWTGGTDALAA